MSARIPLALAVALSAAAPAARAQAPGFAPGEQIDMVVDFLHVRTGQARITVGHAEGSVWPVICQAKTDGLAGFLDIREHYVAYWNADTRSSVGSDLSAVEVGDRHVDSARFDRTLGKATFSVSRKGRRSEKTFDVPPDTHDVASAVLSLRVRRLAPGDHVEMPVFTGSQTFQLVADVAGREVLSTPAGKFSTVRVRVRTAFGGKFREKRDTTLWFSDDPRHVPVRAAADFAVGSVVATITAYRPGNEVATR